MNRHIRTVIVAPMAPRRRACPARPDNTFRRRKGRVVLDRIRTVDTSRLPVARAREVAGVLVEMFSFA